MGKLFKTHSLGSQGKVRVQFQQGKLVSLASKGSILWEKFPVVQYVPSQDGKTKNEPQIRLERRMKQEIEQGVLYELESVYHFFWLRLEKGELYGEGQLFDGAFSYRDPLFNIFRIPRHFDSNKASGPGKKDSGIAPFAIGTSLMDAELGGFFFNPARSYEKNFNFPGLSTDYVYNPYIESSLNEN